jgi:hypothetical protein
MVSSSWSGSRPDAPPAAPPIFERPSKAALLVLPDSGHPFRAWSRQMTALQKNVTVGVFRSHGEAEAAIRQLQQAGFDMKKLSIVCWCGPMAPRARRFAALTPELRSQRVVSFV